jgi:hypothetical protein
MTEQSELGSQHLLRVQQHRLMYDKENKIYTPVPIPEYERIESLRRHAPQQEERR